MTVASTVVALSPGEDPRPSSLLASLERVEAVEDVVSATVEEAPDGGVSPACVVASTDGSLAPVEAAVERHPEAPVLALLEPDGDVSAAAALDAGASDAVHGDPGGDELLRRRVADAIERRRLDYWVRGLLRDPTAAVCLLAPDGTVERANDVARDAVDGELVGVSFWELPWCRRAAREPSSFEAAVERAVGGELVHLETRGDDGRARDAEVVLRGADAPSTRFADGAVATVRGVTDVGASLRERPLLRTIVENVPVVLYAFDAEGEFLLLEGRGLERIGLEPGAAVGHSVFDVFEGREAVLEQCRRALDGERVGGVVEFDDVAFETWHRPVTEDGEVTTVIGAALDVTDHEERKRELSRQNERLEEFASIVSHDLRNPLNVARGGLERIETDPDEADVDRVRDALDRMTAIVDDVLTLARNGEAVEAPEPTSLPAVARRAWGTIRTGEATVSVDADATVGADRDRLQRLLENLFANAVTHGGEGVSVRVGVLEEGFYVADDGYGIPPSDREAVFESGYTTERTGTGFGLAIVREIAEAHDWSVSVTESESGGARFEVTGVTFLGD